MDRIDRVILEELLRNARLSSQELAEKFRDGNVQISDRGVRYRIQKLEREGIIRGYSLNLSPEAIGRTVDYLALIKTSHQLEAIKRYADLERHFKEAPFCSLVARTEGGDFDWVVHYRFNSREEAELEILAVRLRFKDVIEDYQILRLNIAKEGSVPPFAESEVERLKQLSNAATHSSD